MAKEVAGIASNLLTQTHCELGGRTPFGGGLLKVQTYEVAELIIPNPSGPSDILRQRRLSAFERLASRPVRSIFEELGFELCRVGRCTHPEHPHEYIQPEALTLEQVRQASPDRYELDAVFFDVLGLTDEERLAVHRAVC